MKDRVHRYLDGELQRSELTPEELKVAEEFGVFVDALKSDGAEFADTDLVPAVMNRIAARARRGRSDAEVMPDSSIIPRALGWLTGPREISLRYRPAYGLAAVVLLLAAWLLPLAATSPGTGPSAIATAVAPPSVFVRFEIEAPDASSVRLAGSFSGWQPDIALRRVANGRWMALVPLPPGVHDYAFEIDGQRWAIDPSAPRVADGFGGYNSRLSLVLTDS